MGGKNKQHFSLIYHGSNNMHASSNIHWIFSKSLRIWGDFVLL